MTTIAGNPYYTAPECLSRTAPYSYAADLFAYGILLCELITRKPNQECLVPRTSSLTHDLAQLPFQS
ncbi:unnamed protein product [Protopolystoma xenopodis]|uniref:Protein kinase domain-containing protein n=1 Tax=Protopolystoma xenopodis TaxID=117903 RepID=A0A3S5BCL5_9PLAT|nr:unnamed protein product [Protopolystoma xenopodis]